MAAAAWIISMGDTKHLYATFLMANISSHTSHHIEPEGTFRALHHLNHLNMTPTMVEQWCDSKHAVKDSSTPLGGPSMMIKVEAYTTLATLYLRNRFPFHTNIQHIYEHQDTRSPKHHKHQDDHNQPTTKTVKPWKNLHPTHHQAGLNCV